MKQLQAWADEGLYDWDNPTLDEGFKWMQMGSSDIRDFQPFEAFRFVDSWEPFVQCVLDGTIQVWRPVEHYPPPENAEVLALFLVSENAGYEHGIVETNVEKGFTHWQPLPQPPQEGAMLELEPIVLNEKNHYIMYTLVEDFGGCDHIFENGERRMVWHRQSAFDTKEEVMAHFEDYCQKYPNMSYIIVTPKIYLEEPHKTIVAGLITARTIYSGVDQWTRSVNKLSEDYNIIAERRVK
jgi:hypothetical protein